MSPMSYRLFLCLLGTVGEVSGYSDIPCTSDGFCDEADLHCTYGESSTPSCRHTGQSGQLILLEMCTKLGKSSIWKENLGNIFYH